MSRVRSLSWVVLLGILLFSMAAAVAAVPYWDIIMVSGTLYWPTSNDEVHLRGSNDALYTCIVQ